MECDIVLSRAFASFDAQNGHNSTPGRIVIYIARTTSNYQGGTAAHVPPNLWDRSKMDTSATNGCAHYAPVIRGSSNIRGRLRTRAIRNKASRLSGACHYSRMIKSIIDAKHARRRSSKRTSNHRGVLIGIDRRTVVGYTYVSRIDEKSGWMYAREFSHTQISIYTALDLSPSTC